MMTMNVEKSYGWMLFFSSFYGFATTINIQGTIDSTITLNCSLLGLASGIIWIGPPGESVYSVQNYLLSDNIPDNLKPRLKIEGDFANGFYNLQIQSLHSSDEGLYKCLQFDTKNSESFSLHVTEKVEKIKVKVAQSSYVGKFGGSVTLGCIVSSKTSAISQVRWYFYSNGTYHQLAPIAGKYSEPTPKNPSLTIEKLDLKDVGPYTCSATNAARFTANSTTPTTLTLLDFKDSMFAYTCISVLSCFLFVLLVVTFLVVKKRKPVFFMQIAYTFQKSEDDDSKLWDAFVSFKSQETDNRFVSGKLYMKLEKQLGYKLCIHHKDFLPGKAIANNIVEAIANSRRTILIISREYLLGGYTTFELEMAHAEMITTKSKHKIIPILLDKFENLQGLMDDTLKCIIQSVTYITWPGEMNHGAVKSFWKRLELSMPKKSRKNRLSDGENTPLLRSSLF